MKAKNALPKAGRGSRAAKRSSKAPSIWRQSWPPAKPKFSPAQLDILRNAGVEPEGIEELSARLQFIRIQIEPAQPIGPVRELLKELDQVLQKAETLIRGLIKPTEYSPLLEKAMIAGEAQFRLRDVSEDPDLFEKAQAAMVALRGTAKLALQKLPVQRRYQAPWMAVQTIEDGLLRGFIKHHHAPMPPRTLLPERYGRFKTVVETCWQAAGSNSDPEKAIRKFLEHRELTESLSRARAGIPFGGFGGFGGAPAVPRRGPGRRKRVKGLFSN